MTTNAVFVGVGALVWAGFLVTLSVHVHQGKAGDDWARYVVGGFFAGALWPCVVAVLLLWLLAVAAHRFIGLFVPRASIADAALRAAQREVEVIAPDSH